MPLRDYILNNIFQKIFSLVLAVLVWSAIKLTAPEEPDFGFPSFPLRQQDRGDYRLPITVMNSAFNTRAFKVSPNIVDVVVSGDANKIKELDPSTIHVFVDVSTVTTNTIVPVIVSPPPDITLKQVRPGTVTVEPISVDTNSVAFN